jgi:hypothetical protein
MIIDLAWGRPGVKALEAANVTGVMRYASHDTSGKNLSWAEAHSYLTATPRKISVGLIWESTAGRVQSGKAGGVADAKAALAMGESWGMPKGRPVYFACDYDAGPHDCDNYLKGVASVIGLARTGLYAGFGPIHSAFNGGLITWGWQTYAWSGGQWDNRAQLQQYSNGHTLNGVGIDYNRTGPGHTDWGGWLTLVTPTPPPKPVPTPTPAPGPTAPPFSGRNLSYPPTTVGTEVKAWQAKMHARGWTIVVDGAFGPKSKAVCLAFQNDKHLTHRDGIVGLETWRATWESPVT